MCFEEIAELERKEQVDIFEYLLGEMHVGVSSHLCSLLLCLCWFNGDESTILFEIGNSSFLMLGKVLLYGTIENLKFISEAIFC